MATLVPTTIPPDVTASVFGGDNVAYSARTDINEYGLLNKRFSGEVFAQYATNRQVASMFDVLGQTGSNEDQFIQHSDVDASYRAPGEFFTADDNLRFSETSITPDKPVTIQESVWGYDQALAHYDPLAPLARQIGYKMAQVDETKAIKALCKTSLTDHPTAINYYGTDGSTDYGLAASRTGTLTGFTSKAALLADTTGAVFADAITAATKKIIDLGDDPSNYALMTDYELYKWFVRTDEGKLYADNDINPSPGNYAEGIANWRPDMIRMMWARWANVGLGQNVTFGWAADTGFEPNRADKYTSDNSKLVGVIFNKEAVCGRTVLGMSTKIWDENLTDSTLVRGKYDIAYQGKRYERAFPLILAT